MVRWYDTIDYDSPPLALGEEEPSPLPLAASQAPPEGGTAGRADKKMPIVALRNLLVSFSLAFGKICS